MATWEVVVVERGLGVDTSHMYPCVARWEKRCAVSEGLSLWERVAVAKGKRAAGSDRDFGLDSSQPSCTTKNVRLSPCPLYSIE